MYQILEPLRLRIVTPHSYVDARGMSVSLRINFSKTKYNTHELTLVLALFLVSLLYLKREVFQYNILIINNQLNIERPKKRLYIG